MNHPDELNYVALDLPSWCTCPDDCDCDGVLVPIVTPPEATS